MTLLYAVLLLISYSTLSLASTCLSASSTEVTINSLFSKGGQGTIVQLCPSTTYTINGTITFTAANQELLTKAYPTGTTRATILLGYGNSVSTLVSGGWLNGVRLKNVIVDGARATNGLIVSGGGANIEFGGGSNGQIISYVASRNPRSWSCMHVIESGETSNPCTNATVTYNDVGPCGESGTDANGAGLWADGISFACTNSLVSSNTITGSTDGGIVIFGAPGTTVSKNTINSSATYAGFGGINMVDSTYNGNYSGVVVTGNHITGTHFFAVGIAIGASVWGVQSSSSLTGPATVTDNWFVGNITFPVAINGWWGGLTVTGNSITGVAKPSTFSDLNGCSFPTQQLWEKPAPLSYYSRGISGPLDLQAGFVNSTAGSPTYFLCTEPMLPESTSWSLGGLTTAADGTVANVHNGVSWQFQGSDGNLVIYNTTLASANAGWTVLWASGGAPGADCNPSGSENLCELLFQEDGNLVACFNGTAYWDAGTNPGGETLVLADKAPWLSVLDGSGKVLWSA